MSLWPYSRAVLNKNLVPPGYLHTEAASIVAADGRSVRLAGVNWYGFECAGMVPGGLDVKTIDQICQQMVDLGFNHFRLPYCDQVVFDNPRITEGLEANPSLQGKTALEVMDAVIKSARRHGLRVIIDNHRSDAAWSGQQNGLWYTPRYTPAMWLASLKFMAQRYKGNDTVIGIDLRNEPGSPPIDPLYPPRNGGAIWGQPDKPGARNPRDWATAAETAGNAILTVNPNLLIFVEGVRGDPAGPMFGGRRHLYWPGGNLTGVRKAGGRRPAPRLLKLAVSQRLVYSVHDYGPAMDGRMPWCQLGTTASTPDACRSVWDATWGFIVREGIAPIYLGEFGTPNGMGRSDAYRFTEHNSVDAQGSWFTYLLDYLNELDASWAYWPLNGRFSPGAGGGVTSPEGFGLLTPDYGSLANPALMAKLRAVQRPARRLASKDVGRRQPPSVEFAA